MNKHNYGDVATAETMEQIEWILRYTLWALQEEKPERTEILNPLLDKVLADVENLLEAASTADFKPVTYEVLSCNEEENTDDTDQPHVYSHRKKRPKVADYLEFDDEAIAIQIRQALAHVTLLLNRSCFLYEHSKREEDKRLYKRRIGAALGEINDIFTDLFIAHPELALGGWKSDYDWEDVKSRFR